MLLSHIDFFFFFFWFLAMKFAVQQLCVVPPIRAAYCKQIDARRPRCPPGLGIPALYTTLGFSICTRQEMHSPLEEGWRGVECINKISRPGAHRSKTGGTNNLKRFLFTESCVSVSGTTNLYGVDSINRTSLPCFFCFIRFDLGF